MIKQKKYAADQILTKLREVDCLYKDGKTIHTALECIEISEETYYRWRKKYGWLTAEEYQKMRELEKENARLKALMQLWIATLGESSIPPGRESNLHHTK